MKRIALAAVCCSVVWWCGVSRALAQPTEWKGPLVVVIGIDGLSIDGVERAKDPELHRFMEQSAWTLQARGVMPTLSSPNWESAITGAGPEQHGITSNGILGKMSKFEPVCKDAEGHFPTVFEVLHTQQPNANIAIFHEWAGFADLLEKSVPNVLQHGGSHEKITEGAMEYWKAHHPALLFVHLDIVDHTGHDSGWSTGAYFKAVAAADKDVGELLDMVKQDKESSRTYILLTSDHGGKNRNHGGNSIVEITIPWMITGPDIVTGQIHSPVYIYDTAATIAWIFSLNAPECWIGRPAIAAFRPTAITARNGLRSTPNTAGCEPAQRPAIAVTPPATPSTVAARDLLAPGVKR
jgi:predicted AlkP superfamily pyrophosphatase or phosphodiesterase